MKKELFSGTYFLIISILTTAVAVASFLNGAPDVFAILFSVSAWLIYSSARSEGLVKGFKLGSGTVKAMFIVCWVLVGLIALSGILVMLFPNMLYSGRFGNFNFSYSIFGTGIDDLSKFIALAGNAAFVWLGLSFLIAAAIVAVINILYVRILLMFVRSLRFSAENDVWDIEKAEVLSKWMFVLGIISACGILGIGDDSFAAFGAACSGAAMIVTSRWLKYCVVPACIDTYSAPQSDWYSSEL